MASATERTSPQRSTLRAGWRDEATAVINDVEQCVASIQIAEKLESNSGHIFLNVTILEGDRFTVELCGRGFRVAGKDHDVSDIEVPHVLETDEEEEKLIFFETPYSLLSSLSPKFNGAFGKSLSTELEKLAALQAAESDAQ